METSDWDAVQETIEILLDEALMTDIERGVEDLERGDTISWNEAQEELNWQ